MFDSYRTELEQFLSDVGDNSLYCMICTEMFNYDTNEPILFRCKHTFCRKCVNKHFHFKQFAGINGLCIVDRTEVL
jgi:hypothetical protein